MNISLKPSGAGWSASSDTKTRATGKTPALAIIALKRASMMQLAKGDVDVDYIVEWLVSPRRDVAERDKRVLGKVVKWKKHEMGRPFTGLDAKTFAWLVDQRFVLPEQPMVVGANAAQVRAFMEGRATAAKTAVTASGYVIGNGRNDCRVEIEALVDVKGKPVKIGKGPVKTTNIPRQTQGVELTAEIAIRERAPTTWTWESAGGAVSGTSKTLEDARDDAARAAWRALAKNLGDEDIERAAAFRLQFDVTTTSPWVVDHQAADMMRGGYRFAATFAQLKKALGAPLFDPFDGEPLYGWGFRGLKGKCAWLGVRLRDHEGDDELTERDAVGYAKIVDEFELAATDDKTAESVAKWLRAKVGT